MNHKILEQIKGGAFLAGDLPMSTSSTYYMLKVIQASHKTYTKPGWQGQYIDVFMGFLTVLRGF
jgi:hypothetical protein